MNKIFNGVEFIKDFRNGSFSRYIVFDKELYYYYAVNFHYDDKGRLSYVFNNSLLPTNLKGDGYKRSRIIGHIWHGMYIKPKSLPKLLRCYHTNGYMIIPISKEIVLSYGTADRAQMVNASPFLSSSSFNNSIIMLPSDLSIDLLSILINSEKKRLNRCKLKQSVGTSSLEESINFLLLLKDLPNAFYSIKERLPKGTNMSDYHQAVITVCEYVLGRIKGNKEC